MVLGRILNPEVVQTYLKVLIKKPFSDIAL